MPAGYLFYSRKGRVDMGGSLAHVHKYNTASMKTSKKLRKVSSREASATGAGVPLRTLSGCRGHRWRQGSRFSGSSQHGTIACTKSLTGTQTVLVSMKTLSRWLFVGASAPKRISQARDGIDIEPISRI